MITDAIQLQVLHGLLSDGIKTRYGKENYLEEVRTYRDFKKALSVTLYGDIKSDIESLKKGASDLYWPGSINKFAVSSGTTGEGKHLPLTDDRLYCDRKFMRKILWAYLRKHPNIFPLMGKHLSLPGTVKNMDGIRIGEISGFSAQQSPAILKPFQLVNPNKLNRLPFSNKFELALEKAIGSNLKVIIGVPSWILTLFQKALELTGSKSIAEIWPDLKLLVCGGVKLSNYRSHLNKLAEGLDLDFIETYGASEGYFAFTDKLDKNDLKLIYDNGIFYEFVPDPLPDLKSLRIQDSVPIWDIQKGVSYAMIVTTNAGLWRYAMDDIIEFTSVDPPRIKIKGRLGEKLDEFGEAVNLVEAQEVLTESTHEMDLETGMFTIGAYLDNAKSLPRHHWFIQFVDPIHSDTLQRLGNQLDQKLQEINRHYAIRRESEALGTPKIHSISQQDINRWMEHTDNITAQSKLPDILTRKIDIEFFLKR